METDQSHSHWQLRTLKQAYEERPPTEYVVDKFFSRGSLNVAYGAPGVMKSMILADLCCAVVSGGEWLPGCTGNGSEGIRTKKAPILWYDYDNGQRRTDERFDALGSARGLKEDSPLYYVSMPQYPFFANDVDRSIYMMQVIEDAQAELVVIDNLGLITGDVEENSAAMAQVMSGLRVIADRTNCALVVIHHQRKGGANNGNRAGDALRGHSSIEAALDLAIHFVREPNANEIVIRSTKTRGVDVPQLTARFQFEHRPGTNDLAKAWFDGVPLIRGDNPVKQEIVTVLEANPEGMFKGRLVDIVYDNLRGEVGINKIRNWVGDMVAVTGEVVEEKGERGAKILKGRGY